MGFCGLSTAAIAALYGQSLGLRVCVFDYDVHSGNGTIEALLGKKNILFAEIRTMTMDAVDTEVPFRAYPYPAGCSLDPEYWYDYIPSRENLILEDMFLGTTGEEYLERFSQKILPKIEAFNPQLLIISAGFDCMKGDPLGDLGLERRHIANLVSLLVGKGIPSVTVLEGGYDLHNVKEGLAGHFEGLLGSFQLAFCMKLRSESVEDGDFSDPTDEFKNRFSGRIRIEIPSGLKIDFRSEKAPLSTLAVAGFMQNAG